MEYEFAARALAHKALSSDAYYLWSYCADLNQKEFNYKQMKSVDNHGGMSWIRFKRAIRELYKENYLRIVDGKTQFFMAPDWLMDSEED